MVVCDMDQKELDHMINRLHLEYMDVVPGCLLDNLMLSSPTLLVMVSEKYLTGKMIVLAARKPDKYERITINGWMNKWII